MKRKINIFIRRTAAVCILLGILMCGTGCRNEPSEPKEKIESITFEKERVVIRINEETTIKVTAKSDAAKKNEKIAYTSVNEGVVEIREPSNDGFIVKGLKGGSTVITAKSKEVTSYFEVDVIGEDINVQYINVPTPVVEINEGEKRTVQVSLYNGNVLDNNGFRWAVEENKQNISIDVTQNLAVITGVYRGNQKITISHEKSEYDSEIIVFVKGVDEAVQYITSDKNVVVIPNDGQYHDITVSLVNGSEVDKNDFNFEVTAGEGIVDIIPNRNICNIKCEGIGTAVITVSHPLAVIDFEIRVITVDVSIPYIMLEKTFAILSIGDYVQLSATVENPRNPATMLNDFSYTVEESRENVIETVQTNNQWFIRANKSGNARLIISNVQAELSREMLVVVRDAVLYKDNYYITTSQNVIMTQVGDPETQLSIQLVNGNESDRNGFEWVVDDRSIITVESGNGNVRYSRAQIESVFNGIAVITPQNAGTAKITISHYKSESNVTVMVKVYPKGTFAEMPVRVGTDGLFKVVKGTPLPVSVRVTQGDESKVGELEWKTKNAAIVAVRDDLRGMTNILNGITTGVTQMVVDGSSLESPHESIVMSGTQEELDSMSVIYVDDIYQKIVTEQVARIEVKDSNNFYGNSNDFSVDVEDKNMVYAIMVKNQLVLQGKDAGETTAIIRHKLAMNEITINIRVEPAFISIDKPYYISGEEIVGVSMEADENISIKLTGAPEVEKGKITWQVDDTSVIDIIGNGESAIIKAKTSEKQTKIRINHPKSQNEKIILVYTAETKAELAEKVAIGLKNEHYLLTVGENILISLITNASDEQKLGIQWNIRYGADVITVDPNYDSAMMRTVSAGNAEIEVSHPRCIIPATIYISVVEGYSDEKAVKGPATIELLVNESRIVEVTHKNLTQVEAENIRWDVEDKSIANIQENGDQAYILGLKKGVSYVNIRQEQLGFKHRSTLLCANTPEELESMYIMGVQDSYHVMKVDDEKRVRLEFGSAGFPETERANIQWNASGNNVVRVVPNGDQATVIAVNQGVGTVTVSSPASLNEVAITFEVRGKDIVNEVYEFRGHDRIVGIVVGQNRQVVMRMYNGQTEVTSGYSLLAFENKEKEWYNDVLTAHLVDNVVDINAVGVGQSYVAVNHPKVNDYARILAYTALTQEELDSYYPIAVDKSNYLIQVGESVEIKLSTIESKDAQNIEYIQWGIENSNVIESPVFRSKKEAVIKGKFAGQCVVNISFKGQVVEKIYIAVVENNTIDVSKNIVTESIIGMVKGTVRETVIQTNLTESEANTLRWESGNEDLITVVGRGRSATITAKGAIPSNNEAYVTVSYGSWLKRHILVYVCDDADEVRNYRAMNIENQYYRVGRNETVIVPVYYAPNKPAAETVWTDRYANDVVEFASREQGGKVEITSLNEGVAVLEAANTGRNNNQNPLRIYVEVSNKYTNLPKTPELKYLTVTKTLYVLNPDMPDIFADITVDGIGMSPYELQNIKWDIESGSEFVKIFPNGPQCKVLPNRLEGDSIIRAYYLDNIIKIKIIVSRNPIINDIPYIVMDDVVRLGNGETRTIPVQVMNGGNYDKGAFAVAMVTGSTIIDAEMTGDMLSLTGKQSGQALIRISHKPLCQFDKEVVVIVTTSPDGIVYLTTRDNFSVIKRNEYTTLSVDMVGYDDRGGQGYTWAVDAGSTDIVSINASGKQAQVMGKAVGTAKIIVRHDFVDDDFKLSLYVRVTEMDITPVYITTERNIISIVEGTSTYIQAELVNGKPEEMMLFQWVNTDTEIIKNEGYGSQIIVMGMKYGIGKVRITHPSSMNQIDVIIIVERDRTSENIYITTDSNLVEIRPQETRRVSVQLVGGDLQDIYGFKWEIFDYVSIEKVPGTMINKDVIRLVASADGAYITGLNEGEATIQVSHPRTNYKINFKVDVQLYSKINFAQKNLTINMGESTSVPVEAPSGMRVLYSASEFNGNKVVEVYGTNSVLIIEGLQAGVSIIAARNPQGTMSDEMIVEVKYVENVRVRYIETPETLFNTTNLRSQRFNITAKTVGEKDNGTKFVEADDNFIKWDVISGKDVIELNNGFQSVQGKTCSVGALDVGSAEIALTHEAMGTAYSKRLYVSVIQHDDGFRLTPPYFIDLMEGDDAVIACDITNVNNVNYLDVEWRNSDKTHEKLKMDIIKDGKEVRIIGIEKGDYVISATYGGKTISVQVGVRKKRSFDISANYVTIMPDETRTVNIYVEPPETQILWQTDYSDFLKQNSLNFIRDADNNIVGLSFTGGDREGYTRITLKTGYGAERIMTVYTTYNFQFGPKLTAEIRGKPGDVITFPFIINPADDVVTFLQGTNKNKEQTKEITAVPVLDTNNIDPKNRFFTVELKQSGFAELRFESPYNKKKEPPVELVVPVYVYYDDVEVTFEATPVRGSSLLQSDTLYSRIDSTGNVIYLADNEKLTIKLDVKQKGSDVKIVNVVFISNMTGFSFINATDNPNNYPYGYFWAERGDFSRQPSGNNYDMKKEVTYFGILKVTYSYSTGGKDPNAGFEKSFLVYTENYLRRN